MSEFSNVLEEGQGTLTSESLAAGIERVRAEFSKVFRTFERDPIPPLLWDEWYLAEPIVRGASQETLTKRAMYGGRKGRSAQRRLKHAPYIHIQTFFTVPVRPVDSTLQSSEG